MLLQQRSRPHHEPEKHLHSLAWHIYAMQVRAPTQEPLPALCPKILAFPNRYNFSASVCYHAEDPCMSILHELAAVVMHAPTILLLRAVVAVGLVCSAHSRVSCSAIGALINVTVPSLEPILVYSRQIRLVDQTMTALNIVALHRLGVPKGAICPHAEVGYILLCNRCNTKANRHNGARGM